MISSWRQRLFFVAATLCAASIGAQQPQPTFTPDHPTGIYARGERVGWTVTSLGRLSGRFTYTVKRNGGTVVSSGIIDLSSGRARIETTSSEPAMLLVEVKPPAPDTSFGDRSTGGPGRVLLGAAVAPEAIKPAEPKPADFDAFWTAKIAQLNAIPMNATVTPGESGKAGVEWSTVRMNNVHGAHIYGQVAKPAREGKFPGLIIYQWASPPYPLQKSWVTDRAAEGWLALNVEPHDVPADMSQTFYDALPAMLKSYNTIGQHSRDDSYFLQMYLGAYRAVDYLATRPDWDGKTIVVMGTSMGGQQSFATAGLNPKVTALIVNVPAGADVTASLHGRAPSYPNWNVKRADVRETARYFDTANFASRITARCLVAMGFIDEVATPAGIWSVVNQIRGPKEVAPMIESPHNHLATPRQLMPFTRRSAEWLDALVHGGNPAPSQGTDGAFTTGRYRNLLVEAGHSPMEVSAKIAATFQQLFHGDSATQAVYYRAGRNANGPLAYVTDINNHDVRTEGMSYGMMIAVQLDRKAEFDALWNWSKTYMYHDDPKHPSYGFFSWSLKTDGTPNSESPAPDGEEYYAMALYFASARWGDGHGIYDYHAAADRLLSDMKNRGLITGAEARGRTETEWAEFNPVHRMVRFTPDTARRDHTDPSYHLPAFYELWVRWGPVADRAFWADAAQVSRDFFQKTTNPQTGLAPDYANFDGTPVAFGNNRRGASFAADAWRTAANWSVDWSWWAADPRERELSDRIQRFFESNGIDRYGSKFTLDGAQQLDSAHATALVATNAVASLAATDAARSAKFVDALWNAPVPEGQYRYYDGLWYLMGLMHTSGTFRVWTPAWAGEKSTRRR